MGKNAQLEESEELLRIILDAAMDKKAEEVTSINLKKLKDPVCEYFVICHAESSIQVHAIADNILEKVKEETGERVWNKEGYENAQWILLDYSNIVVHVFEKQYRDFYNLEGLWADAEIVIHKDL